jgi:hypothetical protein
MASRRTLRLVVLGALCSAAALVACISSSPTPGGVGSGSGSGGSGSGSGSGGSSSGGSSGSGSGGGSTVPCTWTVSGGATASGSCTAVAAYAANNAITAFSFIPTQSSPIFSISVELGTTPAAFQTGTYTSSNVLKAEGEYFVLNGDVPSVWTMSDNDAGLDGGFTLTLTSTGTQYVVDAGDSWVNPHGTVSLTLNPSTGTSTQVTGTATF